MVPDAGAPSGGVRVRASLPLPPPDGRTPMVVSVVLHIVLILVLIRVTANLVLPTRSPIADGLRLALGGGGGGGKGGAAVAMVPPPKAVSTEVVRTLVTPEPAVVVPPAVVESPTVLRDSTSVGTPQAGAGSGGGSGGGVGTGAGRGTGSGVGPGSGGGTGGGSRTGSPPRNRQVILPPFDGAPKSLRGKSIEVTLEVDAEGRVSGVRVEPPIEDRGFAKKFDQTMRGYRFFPARDSLGNAVARPSVWTFTF